MQARTLKGVKFFLLIQNWHWPINSFHSSHLLQLAGLHSAEQGMAAQRLRLLMKGSYLHCQIVGNITTASREQSAHVAQIYIKQVNTKGQVGFKMAKAFQEQTKNCRVFNQVSKYIEVPSSLILHLSFQTNCCINIKLFKMLVSIFQIPISYGVPQGYLLGPSFFHYTCSAWQYTVYFHSHSGNT